MLFVKQEEITSGVKENLWLCFAEGKNSLQGSCEELLAPRSLIWTSVISGKKKHPSFSNRDKWRFVANVQCEGLDRDLLRVILLDIKGGEILTKLTAISLLKLGSTGQERGPRMRLSWKEVSEGPDYSLAKAKHLSRFILNVIKCILEPTERCTPDHKSPQ